MHKVIRHKCPTLFEQMSQVTDKRKRRSYQVAELLTGGIAMFLLKETSRNAFNNDRSERFKENYFRIFKMRLPHMDTAHTFLASLAAFELEDLKAAFVATLIEQKMFQCIPNGTQKGLKTIKQKIKIRKLLDLERI